MKRITITDSDGDEQNVTAVGNWPSDDAIVEANGYDPKSVSYEVDDPQGDLEDAISNASSMQELKDALTRAGGGPSAQAAGKGLGL